MDGINTITNNEFYNKFNNYGLTSENKPDINIFCDFDFKYHAQIKSFYFIPQIMMENKYFTFNNSFVLDCMTGKINSPQYNVFEEIHFLINDTYNKLSAKRKASLERTTKLVTYNELYEE